jgi:HAD superfamily hydrolase (TIGR01484 family)
VHYIKNTKFTTCLVADKVLPIRISAIISDYDGTLCPTASMSSEDKKIPPDLLSVLWNISTKIPVSVVSSKDLQFLRKKIPFARIVSSLMGLETTQLTMPARNFTHPSEIENVITQYHLADGARLTGNSRLLADLAGKVKSEFQDLSIESKFTYVDHMLAGITFDYRRLQKWERYKTNVEPELKKMIQRFIKSSSPNNLFLQIYSDHPFIDVYAIDCDKGRALDTVIRLLNIEEEGKVLYLGDSENDNPAFGKADLSIGIRSDQRIKTKLNSDYILEFNELRPFLQKLDNEDFIFDRISQLLI